MLNVIMNNRDKYPLDVVVHYELEIDWPFVTDVINEIERLCNSIGVKFIKIKPRNKWIDLYNKYGMPGRIARWCNKEYKIDCERQLKAWIKSLNCRPVAYIGFCANEIKRFKYSIGDEIQNYCYPLAEEGIQENDVLTWARNVDCFNGWYKIFSRQGCWLCPNTTLLQLAYLKKYYPNNFEFFMKATEEYETKFKHGFWSNGKYTDYTRMIIETKWTDKLNMLEEDAKKGIYHNAIKYNNL